MTSRNLALLPLTLLSLAANAGDPPADPTEGLTVSMTYPNVMITHYSATPRGGRSCSLEHGVGGRDESSSGYRPLSYTITKPGLIKGRLTTLTAVPARGGTAGIFGCFFTLPDAYPGKLFFAGDRYGSGSNGKMKTDISSPCTSIVNKTMRSKLVVYNCGGKKGGANPPIVRATPKPRPKPAPEEPTPIPVPVAETPPTEIANKCGWYAVLSCDKTQSGASRESSRLGAGLNVVHTNDFPNFDRGWYCAVSGPFDHSAAAAKVREFRSSAPRGYVKKGC